ncbi:hypothetical protein [Actinoplanes friuliensis]|uniref:Uncharacterized protein n=1 Tax=Actinoplanes friuliensis DSM 7358 TaxID=1246995 RepID=U5VW39_9ACTN|nr:hypothetical protein [Actinoplanes friuliensis]AGZ41044.1 hypothetical protein AFR_13790 [Actinoplanes friuliensis DSM 7358]
MRVHSFQHRRYGRVIAAVGLTVLLGFTGACGGSDDKAAGTTATADATAAPADEPAGDCGAAQAEIKASLTGMGAVTSVDVPTCDKAVVATTLGADEGDQAASLCQNAANEASTHGVAAVSVVSADGKELATGTTAEDCKAS